MTTNTDYSLDDIRTLGGKKIKWVDSGEGKLRSAITSYKTRKLLPCQQKAKVYDECV